MAEQLLVRALLAQFAFVENENAVGVLDGAEPVRDDQGGAAFEQAVERLADQDFGLGVHARCRFVENQEPRIVRERPREADQLALPHGKSRAAFADVCFDAFRQGIQQGAEPHFAQRGFDARAADVFIAQADVRFQSAGEQERILQHDAELPAQLVHVVAANVHAIEQNLRRAEFRRTAAAAG